MSTRRDDLSTMKKRDEKGKKSEKRKKKDDEKEYAEKYILVMNGAFFRRVNCGSLLLTPWFVCSDDHRLACLSPLPSLNDVLDCSNIMFSCKCGVVPSTFLPDVPLPLCPHAVRFWKPFWRNRFGSGPRNKTAAQSDHTGGSQDTSRKKTDRSPSCNKSSGFGLIVSESQWVASRISRKHSRANRLSTTGYDHTPLKSLNYSIVVFESLRFNAITLFGRIFVRLDGDSISWPISQHKPLFIRTYVGDRDGEGEGEGERKRTTMQYQQVGQGKGIQVNRIEWYIE